MSFELAKLDQARQLLADCNSIQDAKQFHDLAEAARHTAKVRGLSLESVNYATEIKVRSERLMGEILRETPKNKGARGQLNGRDSSGGIRIDTTRDNTSPTLEEIGLTKRQSSSFQTIAAIPEEIFEAQIAETKAKRQELTTKQLLDIAKKGKKAQKQKEAAIKVEVESKTLPPTSSEDCIYKDEWVQAWQGDASNLYFIQDNTVDLTVTSPPYNIGAKNGKGRVLWGGITYDTSKDAMPEEEYQEWQVEVLDELFRVTRPGGSLFYNHKIRNRKGQGIHPMNWIARSKWTFRQQITWDRGSTHNKEMSYFWPHDELIFWLTKGTDDVYLSPEGARMSTIWRFGFETNTDHPAPFPRTLPLRCILAASKPGDVILDPFAGSFTTCAAAKELGRRSIGVDISKTYVRKFSLNLYQEAFRME